MKRFILMFITTLCSAAALTGCGGGGGGGEGTPAPTVATTKMYLFGTMSSASAGGSAGIIDNINSTISSLPAGVTPTSIVYSGTTAAIPSSNASFGFNIGTRDLSISLLNRLNDGITRADVKADKTSNAGKGVEVATLYFSLANGATPPIPTPGTATTVFQYRAPVSVDYLNGCVVNFTTTYH